jgi:hypothetical protein
LSVQMIYKSTMATNLKRFSLNDEKFVLNLLLEENSYGQLNFGMQITFDFDVYFTSNYVRS